MWYLKVSSSLYIVVALICMIQNAISLTVDQTTEDQWSKLESSTDQIDLKKILKLCKNSINSFNEKLENTKTIVNKKLPEPNKTTEDIEKLVNDVKIQIKNSSADLVTVRKLVQKIALRFRDTFKSLASFTELDNESINKELESIKKTTVDGKKPLVNRVVRSFGNRYDLNKLANRVLEISADREKFKNNYDKKKKIAKKELNSLWNSLTNHSKTVNDNALNAFETFFAGMKSLKSVKKKVKTIGEDAINEIKKGDDFNNLKNAVELAKALKLKFEDEWNLDSGELTYSEEQKKDTTKTMDENPVENNEYDNSTNDIEPSLPTTEQETIDNEKINANPSTQFEIEKPSKDDSLTSDKAVSEVEETQLPTESENKDQTTKLQPTIKDDLPDDNISDNINSPIEETSIFPNTENKENKKKTIMVEPRDSNNETNPTDGITSDLSNNESIFNPDITNDETLISPNKNAENNKKDKIINKRTSREKIPILPWQKLIQLDDPQVSQQSEKCESLLNNITPDFDNIKKSAKNSIQVTKNYKTLQKIENETIQRFYDKMVDTNTKLSDYLVNSAEDVCAKVTPINKRYETKFKNDPNIKRIKYLLGKQYDPNQYILKVLDDASHKTGIGGMKKTTYYKMLAVAHNLNHETKEMEDAALYAMNKIYEGKLAATNLQKMFNKEKASKACYIRNILLEKENDAEKKNKDENKEKVKESINNDTNTEPLKPDVNLDSVDDIQPSTINDDNEPTLNNEEEKKTSNDTNESITHNNLGDHENDKTTDEKENTKKENEEQKTEENHNISSIPQNKDSDSTTQTTNDGANKPKRNITKKVTHHRKHRNPNDPNDVSEEYDTIEEIDDEEDDTNEYKSSENKSNITPEAESLVNSDNKQEVAEPKQSENKNEEQKTEENCNISSIPQNKDSDSTIQTTNDGAIKPKRYITRKVTHHRKHRNPNDPNDVSEEYDTIEEIDDEEDDTNEYKSNENKSNITPKAESLVNSNNKQEVEEPEQSEKENGESNEESSSREETTAEGSPDELKTNQRIKRIDPKDGKEISEEYNEEKDGNKLNQPNEKTFGETEKSESPVNADNQDDMVAPEHLHNENVESNEENSAPADTSEGDNSSKSKTKRRRKRIDSKDGNEIISEEYDEEEDGKKLNQPNEKTFGETEKSESPVNASKYKLSNQNTAKTPVLTENVNVESNEENNSSANTSEGDNSDESKTKRHRKRIDPKDRKEYSEENDTFEKDDNNLNKLKEKKTTDTSEIEPPVNEENNSEEETEEVDTNTDITSVNEDTTKENLSKESKSFDENDKTIDQENTKNETEELDENENLNSVEDAELKCVNNEKIIPAEESMGEDSTSYESRYKSPEQSQLDTSNKRPDNRRKDPKNGSEVSEEYGTPEAPEEESKLKKNKIDTPSATPENSENENNSRIPEHEENAEHNQSNEHEPEKTTNEVTNKPSEIDEQPEGVNQPYIKNKRQRRPKKPRDGLEVPEDYETDKQNEPMGDSENNTPSETREYNEDEQSSAIPEHDENSEDNKSYEHDPETPANEVADKPSDIGGEDARMTLPNRRHRRRRDPKTGLEVSEEFDTLEEQDEESPRLEDNKIDTPEYDENPEYNESNEHEPETTTNEVTDKPSEIDEQPEGVNQPYIKNKRQRRPKKPRDGLEVPEDYETDKQNEPLGDSENDTPSETREYNEDGQSLEIPEHDENSEDNNSYEHEPEIPTNEVADKPSEIVEQDKRNNQPNRRYKRRRDPQTGLELSEEFETLEEQDEESPRLEDNKIDTPEYDENPEYNESNEHEPETTTNEVTDKPSEIDEQPEGVNQPYIKNKRQRRPKKPRDGLEVPEDYETDKQNEPLGDSENDTPSETREYNEDGQSLEIPEHDENSEDNNSYEHEPEIPTNEVADKPSEIVEQDKRNNQPNRRYKRRRDPQTGLELSEEFETLEEQDEESPRLEDNKIDTPEYDENPEYNESNEHEPETTTNEVTDKPSEIDEQPEGVNQPYIKNKRQRRPKKPRDGLEVPEDYETDKQNEPLGDSENDTPSETREYNEDGQSLEIPEHDENSEDNNSYEHEPEIPTNEVADKPSEIVEQDKRNNQPNRRYKRRRDPQTGLELSEEFETLEEQDEESPRLEDNKIDTPEYDENPEYNESNEHEPEKTTNEVTDKPSDIGEQDEGNNQPNIKNRRQRRPKKPKNGLKVQEDYETDKQNDESPTSDSENDTPSETREYIEDEQSLEIPKHDENSEDNNSYEHDPETPANEVADKPSDIGGEDARMNLPNRRHRRRRDPKTGLEVSEEFDTLKEQDEESPRLEDNKIDTSEYDENPEYNKSNEHEPEKTTDEVTDKPREIDEQPEGVNQPYIKNKRQRRPKKPRDGLEVPEDYETDKQNEPMGDSENNTPSETREYNEDEQSSAIPEHDENSEDNKSYEHDPETPANEVADKPSDIGGEDARMTLPNRRHRRRRDPKTGLEVSEEFDTLEEQDEESPRLEDNKIDTPEYAENPEYNESNEHEPETTTNEVTDKPSEIDEQPEGVNQPYIKNKRQRRPKKPRDGLEVPEDYETDKQNEPLGDSENDTPSETREYNEDGQSLEIPEHDENSEDNNSYEHEPEIPTNEVADKPSEIVEQDKRNNQPNRRYKRRRDPQTGLELSEEFETLEEQDEESPRLEDNKIDTPEYDENPEYNESNEHEPEKTTNEVTDKPSDIGEQDEGNNQPNIKNRRQRRPKKPKNGLEVPEEYETDKQNEPMGDSENNTPSETREYNEDEQSSAIPEHDENSEDNKSYEHDPETPANEVADKPSDIGGEDARMTLPNRRHRRRRDPKTGLEVSEEFDTLEEQDEESPRLEDNKIDTPEYDENPEYNESNEHEPETTTNEVTDKPSEIDEQPEGVNQPYIKNKRQRRPKKPRDGLEVPEDYETDKQNEPLGDSENDTPSETREYNEDGQSLEIPEHDENSEDNNSYEHEPEIPTNEVADKPSEIVEQDKRNNQPNRRYKRRRDPQTGLELSEEFETLEEQDEESPRLEDNKIDTPEYDENPEYNESNEHEPEKTTNEVTDKPSDIGEQDEGNNQPNIKNRRQRRPKKPKNGLKVQEDYETDKQNDESPTSDSENDTPSETREYIEDEQSLEIPKHDENSEDNNSYEHDPETPANEVADKPSDIGGEDARMNLPNRRHRRRRDPKTGLEVSEEFDTLKEQDEESPRLEDNKIDTSEYDENPEYNKSNEHEPEKTTDEVTDKPREIDEQPEGVNQPYIKNKRQRRPKKPRDGLEVPEDYETDKQNEPMGDSENNTPSETREYNEDEQSSAIPEHDENSEDNKSYEHEPEIPANEVADKPSDIDGEYERYNLPNRRLRQRRDPKTGLDVSEEYDTLEEQDEESPLEDNRIGTPVHDENSEYNQSNNVENYNDQPELSDYPENSDLSFKDSATPIDTNENENVVKPRPRKIRWRRKSKQPQSVYENNNTPIEVNDENINNYPVEDQYVSSKSIPYNDNDVLEDDPHNGYGETNYNESDKNQPELSDYPESSDVSLKDSATPIDTNENENVVKPRPRKIRWRRKLKQPQSVNGNDKTPIEVNDENINNYPVEDQYVSSKSIPYNDNDVLEDDPHNGYGETNYNESDKNQPELSDYPESSDVSFKDSATPIDTNENENVIKPRPRKIRWRRKSKQPQSVYENNNTPIEVNDENINNYPVGDQYVSSKSIPYNDNDVLEDDPHNGYGETNYNESDKNQPELSDYPENSDVSLKDSATPIDTNENENVVKPRPRKIRWRRKLKQPQSVNGNDKTPIEVNDENINNYPVEDQYVSSKSIPYNDNDVLEDDPHNGYGETNYNESDKNQPELSDYPENSDVSFKDSATPIDTNENENVVKPRPRKIRWRRKLKQPQSVNGNDKTPIEVNDENINNYPVEDQYVSSKSIPYNDNDVLEDDPHNGYGETNYNESDKNQPELSDYPENSDVSFKDFATPIDTNENENVVKPRPRKIRWRRKSKQPQSTKIIPTNVDAENSRVPNEEKSTETPEIDPKNIQKNPKKKRHIRHIRTYVVNEATNERIPINDQTYSTTDGLPDGINNKLHSLETDDSNVDDPDSNTDNDDYSSFLFKEYNSDLCKRDAYDRFKKVTSQDAKQIAYRSVLDTSEMRSNMLATIKNAIGNVKASRTFNDVDQSLRTVSYSLKVGLKQTVSDLVIKVIPLAKDFLKTAENLKELYQRGPQSTHKMLTNILENESNVPESANDILRFISPQFDVDELINKIFEKPCTAKSLKEKKVKAQRKLIDLSKHMDTAISNIDCFVLSAMSTVGIGADTLKLLKPGKVIMSDKHPRAKTLRDAVGIIKAGKKIRNNDDSFTPTLIPSDGTTESDEDDDDEDPDQVAQKNEEFLKTVPDLDDDIPIPKKVKNKRQSLGVIVVHPDKQIEYKEVTDTAQLKKFVGDQTKKYKLQSKNKHPKFLKLNSKQLIDAMVADVKKKAERNGMTKKEMVDEIIKNLNSS